MNEWLSFHKENHLTFRRSEFWNFTLCRKSYYPGPLCNKELPDLIYHILISRLIKSFISAVLTKLFYRETLVKKNVDILPQPLGKNENFSGTIHCGESFSLENQLILVMVIEKVKKEICIDKINN